MQATHPSFPFSRLNAHQRIGIIVVISCGFLLLCCLCLCLRPAVSPQSKFSNLTGGQIRYKICANYELPSVEQSVMQESGMRRTDGDDYDVYFPCGYTNAEKELSQGLYFGGQRKGVVMGISGMDNLASKASLWIHMKKAYGRTRSAAFVPPTWLTFDPSEVSEFALHANAHPGRTYIMKKNIQRQEGLHVFTNKLEGLTAFHNGYVVIQEVVQDPFLIGGYKINLRVYLLVTCHLGTKSAYLYDDGFVYYSKVPYKRGNTADEIITTGYRDRNVYENNPLTLRDFDRHTDASFGSGTSSKFRSRVIFILQRIMDATQSALCSKDKEVRFCQLYGVDVQPNRDLLSPVVIEFNKGPSLAVMDARDGALKTKLMRDMYRTVGIVSPQTSDGENGFEEVWRK